MRLFIRIIFNIVITFLIKHEKNDFAEESKILLDINQEIILLGRQNNFVGILKIMSNTAKNFDILTSLSVLHNYFDSSKLPLRCVSS